MISATEQNYLKAIYKLSYRFGTEELASTGDLAKILGSSPATVTDTLQRLSRKNMVHYRRYQGATLSDEGLGMAMELIRLHRLWEVFLVEKLGYGWHQVHAIAEQLEHVYEEGLAEKLDAFLGHPTPVSYTPLTLPTNTALSYSVGSATIKKTRLYGRVLGLQTHTT